MTSVFQNKNIEMYCTHNEGKSVIAERFIRTFKNKIYKYMTSISNNVYIDKLDNNNKYNNKYDRTINMKPADVKPSRYIDSSQEINDGDPKFKIGDIVRMSKYKNIYAKGYVPNWSEEVFIITKVKNTVPRPHVISNIHDKGDKAEEIVGTFYEKIWQKKKSKSVEC